MGWTDHATGAGLDELKPASAWSSVCLVVEEAGLAPGLLALLRARVAEDAALCLLGLRDAAALRAGWSTLAARRLARPCKARHVVEEALSRLPARCSLLLLTPEAVEPPLWLGAVLGHRAQPVPLPEDLPGASARLEQGIVHGMREALLRDPAFAEWVSS
ncbi:hypothetical protein NON00_01395 [Roseomonas sp. GC11]|uniref:hypothetical protein n=1 Tax=Roseomonas sp. GC11 TaxID=2950546 RepID=UPI00210B85AB|nr:hypothetical protein [Roseomonas sp. GC11]MCQ4158583.1 hypothetical protein [Roseomonas sp. GC11]